LFNLGHDVSGKTLTIRVESNLQHLIVKALYLHNGLSICRTKYCKTTFLALPCPIYLMFKSSSSGLHNIITSEVATNPSVFQNCN